MSACANKENILWELGAIGFSILLSWVVRESVVAPCDNHNQKASFEMLLWLFFVCIHRLGGVYHAYTTVLLVEDCRGLTVKYLFNGQCGLRLCRYFALS